MIYQFSFWDQPTRRVPLPFLGANLGAVGSFYLLGNIQSGKSEKRFKSLGKDPAWENEATVEGKGQELLTTIPGRSIDEYALSETGTKGLLFHF